MLKSTFDFKGVTHYVELAASMVGQDLQAVSHAVNDKTLGIICDILSQATQSQVPSATPWSLKRSSSSWTCVR